MFDFLIITMIASIPLTAIITAHRRGQAKIQVKMLEKEIELEQLRLETFKVETDKMKLDLEQSKQMYLDTQKQIAYQNEER
ncbi:hypothetical protein [Lysinibacillus sp. LZ02]|uniref:hypothetical protein n=1 Tax=Lysinibacillus sp. LZ02 TaxID=3420668 RepID=UPI003D36A511